MGSWGPGPFDNDYAVDWYLKLIETHDLEVLQEAFELDLLKDEFFDIDELEVLVVGSEVLLGLLDPVGFRQRQREGAQHVDPLTGELEAISQLQEEMAAGALPAFPEWLADWVLANTHLQVRSLLDDARVLLNHVLDKYHQNKDQQYCRSGESLMAWIAYLTDLQARLRSAKIVY